MGHIVTSTDRMPLSGMRPRAYAFKNTAFGSDQIEFAALPVTEQLYRADAYLLEFDAAVVARTEHEGRPAVVLDRTAFYAESGGQPWDTGTLEGVPVVAVLEQDGRILH